jgi:hypothetical protein
MTRISKKPLGLRERFQAVPLFGASRHIIDHISKFYFLLPPSFSDVIVAYGLNANSPEAA